VAYNPDGTLLASISRPYEWTREPGQPVRWTPGQIKVRDARTSRELWSAKHDFGAPDEHGHGQVGPRVKFSPDGSRVAAPDTHRTVAIWDSRTGNRIVVLPGHDSLITDLAFSPNGSRLASSGMDGTVRLWDLRTGQATGILVGHKGAVN